MNNTLLLRMAMRRIRAAYIANRTVDKPVDAKVLADFDTQLRILDGKGESVSGEHQKSVATVRGIGI